MVETNGKIVWSGEYDAFGNCQERKPEVGGIDNPLRFPGQYHDKETGLYYNLNRYYDPKIGRYLQTDPAGDGLSPYLYAAANPVNAIDPDGLCALRMYGGGAEIYVGAGLLGAGPPGWIVGALMILNGVDNFKTPSMNDTGGTWKSLGKGVRIKRVGNYWIKEVDPEASRFWRWWGRVSLNAQARGLKRIGDMAPEFTYTNGQLRIPRINKFTGTRFQAWKVSLKAKWRLRTIFDDAHIGNIGAGGIVFDPSVHPVMHTVYWTGSIGTGIGGGSGLGYLYYSSRGE